MAHFGAKVDVLRRVSPGEECGGATDSCRCGFTLSWNQIRDGFIYLEETKTKNKREIPINDDLAKVFRKIRRERGLTSKYIFTYN